MNDSITEGQTLTISDQLIISQALYTAIPLLEATPNPELSNIADMKALLEEKFPIWQAVQAAKKNTEYQEFLTSGCQIMEDVDDAQL